MKYEEVMDRIAALKRGKGAFYAVVSNTTPKLTAKNRTTKAPTDFSVSIRSRFCCKLGVSYENCVKNALERQGKDPTFEAQKPFGKHFITDGDGKHNPYILQSDTDASKYYLAVDMMNSVERDYFIDGRKATAEEVENLKENYLPKPSKPTAGSVKWRTYSLESILAIN